MSCLCLGARLSQKNWSTRGTTFQIHVSCSFHLIPSGNAPQQNWLPTKPVRRTACKHHVANCLLSTQAVRRTVCEHHSAALPITNCSRKLQPQIATAKEQPHKDSCLDINKKNLPFDATSTQPEPITIRTPQGPNVPKVGTPLK